MLRVSGTSAKPLDQRAGAAHPQAAHAPSGRTFPSTRVCEATQSLLEVRTLQFPLPLTSQNSGKTNNHGPRITSSGDKHAKGGMNGCALHGRG